jgi:hypothetical protein
MDLLQSVVLSFEDDEYMPLIMAIGHNLKEQNIYRCSTQTILNLGDNFIIHKKCDELDIFLTYENSTLLRGFVYTKLGETQVLDCRTFESLQIGKFCYGNICVVKLSNNPFVNSLV